jgi:arabinogalactan oligomer/maltooligosaccharide transport system substrate-binding protein
MKKLVESPFHLSAGGADQFNSDAAIVVSGTWDFEAVKSILGDNMGVTDLPSFEVDGTLYHLGSFNGCKLMGVKPQVDEVKGAAIHKLAQYLTGEKCQMERFEALSWGPSNTVDQASEAVQANPGLAALIAQAPYSVPQGQIHGSWWDIGKVIAEDVKAATDDAGLQAALDNYQEKIAALFTLSDEVKNGWTVIGTVDGSNWDKDFAMVKGDDGIWKSDAYAMTAGTEFKVRQGLSWDNNFPAENFKIEADGTYIVVFDEAAGAVSVEAQ